ncbi:TPR-like protein [Durotheca rogersii]|uniref:TPR-like protein n=1 Tax=Durotheca rogersii TaxID=419775 RepID=UPI00221F9D36|nr:TPR-like protein [Durotheca rogersii]KAI5865032.1 TPR-like protein [Durotheca rogersii]
MAPRRPDKKKSKHRQPAGAVSPQALVRAAEAQLQEGNVGEAAALAEKALAGSAAGSDGELAARGLLGQIGLEAGNFAAARAHFLRAAALDPDGSRDEASGGGPDTFLCLAQLSEEGGRDSVAWFEKGAAALRKRIRGLEEDKEEARRPGLLAELRRKLAATLCSVAEVYMTDLSWEAEAEARCEALVTEATLVAPESAESWQTLANVRISQARAGDARAALARSLELWRDLAPADPAVPDYASRVGLGRLLMEVAMEREALDVLERLVAEDDESVEVWYLGGWGLYVMGEKKRKDAGAAPSSPADGGAKGKEAEDRGEDEDEEEDWGALWTSSRVWLNQCLHLYKLQDYEDDRLGEHAAELLAEIAKELGEAPAGEDDGEDDWEDEEDNDEEMQG